MSNRLFKCTIFLITVAAPVVMYGQSKVGVSVGADAVSSYIWRGQSLGSGAVQPSASLEYKGLSLGAWGSYGVVNSDDTKELDFTLSYSVGKFNVGITDYWFSGMERKDRYFLYDSHKTAHVFEFNVGYDFGVCSLNWFTNFAGNDYKKNGKHAYSSYFEIAAPFSLGGLEWDASLGMVPFESSSTYMKDEENPVDGFAVTNISLKVKKKVKMTERFSLPLFASVTANPNSGKMYLTAGVSF
ncbi:MAG: hypothetical protein NC206_09320 [Bacteroides sp.]|nr:hypothetical protein [Roseburia sp.]MCM1347270.1 hypothetical protein [Bacteroides sp.]MCM1421076.1 hypothetical protein [Bacteroides sp.]